MKRYSVQIGKVTFDFSEEEIRVSKSTKNGATIKQKIEKGDLAELHEQIGACLGIDQATPQPQNHGHMQPQEGALNSLMASRFSQPSQMQASAPPEQVQQPRTIIPPDFRPPQGGGARQRTEAEQAVLDKHKETTSKEPYLMDED